MERRGREISSGIIRVQGQERRGETNGTESARVRAFPSDKKICRIPEKAAGKSGFGLSGAGTKMRGGAFWV